MLGQRTLTKGLRVPYYYWVVAFVVGLFALVAASWILLFFAAGPSTESTSVHPPVASSALTEASIAEKASLDSDVDNDGQVDSSMANSLVASSGGRLRGWLDNDLDNDGLPDGMTDPLVGLGLVSLLIPSVGGSLVLLSVYKLPMVGCDYCPTLERPG